MESHCHLPRCTYIDNAACIVMGKMPVFSERQKHIPIRVCHLKECCDEEIVELRHIGTKYQLADIGTKALSRSQKDRTLFP